MSMIEPLIDLQDVDGSIRSLEGEVRDLPRRKAQETARMAGVNAALDIARRNLESAEKLVRDCEAEATGQRDKARELRIAQASSQSNKEFSQLMVQIENLEREADAAESRQLALMDNLPSLKAAVDAAAEKVAAEKGGVDGFVGELDDRLAKVKGELEALYAERREKAAKVEPRFLLYYERLRAKRWPVVVRLSEDGVCDGCHLVQPPSVAQMVEHNVKASESGKAQTLVACTMCGRILFRD